ncbi:MAG: hypothetical protein CVU84_00340 [Firmicutes bacterium HGW-Firmicutes-1]|jgi:drug/metabolite transporter (DMT)-like permease|nr:MAG: hypothetical protein CVU84_00340 [Firmicutes bacterium HGW-Firmicutes-1]
MKKTHSAYIQLSLAMFFAGSTVVAGKYMVDIPIFISQTISLMFALVFIFPLAIIKEGKISQFKIKKKDWFLLFLQGLTGIFMFRIFILLGLRLTSAIEGGIIMSTTPAILALCSFLFLKEKITRRILLGIMISVSGILLLNTNGIVSGVTGSWSGILGNFFVLLAVVGEVLFTIFRKKQSFESHPLTTTAFVILFAFLLFLPVGAYHSLGFNWDLITPSQLIPMFYYGAICSALGYTCWFSGISKVKVNVAAGFSGVMPISSVILSVIILGEKITWQHIIGMLLALLGIYTISSIRKSKLPQSSYLSSQPTSS